MTDNVIPFRTADGQVGDGVKISAEQILSAAIEANYQTAVVIGRDEDGNIRVHSTDGLAETMLLMERGKLNII